MLLREWGYELRRPAADYLGEGIYELRVVYAGRRFRILYAFDERERVVLLCGFVKDQARVPKRQLLLARHRMNQYKRAPARYTAGE
jgi:phage-related protein